MSKFHQALSYFDYWLTSVEKHSLQAPFIYELFTKVISKKSDEKTFAHIEQLRDRLRQSTHTVAIKDFGAGSKINDSNERPVKSIATNGITKKKYSQLLYRLASHFEAKHIVELGTSLGVNTLYLASCPSAKVATFEGSPSLSNIALEIFDDLSSGNITLIEGEIDKTLHTFLMSVPSIDMAFIDANHRLKPTIEYFDQLLQKIHDKTCLVFDDIHWSKEMEQGWLQIKNHYRVTLTIDLYQMGIVFFNPELRKQHYVLQF